jgi:hypothetical protein
MESGIGLMIFLMRLCVFSGLSWLGMKAFRYYYEMYPFKMFKKAKKEHCKEEELTEDDIVGYAPEEDDLP